jgi:hypothetical protein
LPSPPYSGHHGPLHPEILEAGVSNGSDGPHRYSAQLPSVTEVTGGNYFPPPKSTCAVNPFALVAALAVELLFVWGSVVFAKLSPAHAVDTAASTTVVAVACLYSRNAVVTIGRRLVGTAEHDKQ